MKTTQRVIRRGGVALLIVGMVVALSGAFTVGAQAKPDKEPDRTLNDHPSGKDKNAEPGGSRTQGNSPSDPDGDTNGGADKPGGDGGFDADKDGNNGCGNDDDFEDDNNGNCGGRRVAGANGMRSLGTTTTNSRTTSGTTTTTPTVTTPTVTTVASSTLEEAAVRVLGTTFTRDFVVPAAAGGADETRVLGVSLTRGSRGGNLAATGAPIVLWALFGLALIAAGGVVVKKTR